jgi:histidine triad (HIT) family protein
MGKADADCIFCKIVAGELPSHQVYEDDAVLAFLDIQPLRRGHTLVIPKAHHRNLTATPVEVLQAVAAALPRIANAVVMAVEADGFNVLQSNAPCAGQEVFHTHFHVIPRNEGDGIGLGFRHGEPVEDDLGATAESIRAAFQPPG